MPTPVPAEDLTLTQTATGDSAGTLAWTHPSAGDVDRWMLGFKLSTDDEWTNLEPVPKATFGAGPYEADVLIAAGIEWRVVPIGTDGTFD